MLLAAAVASPAEAARGGKGGGGSTTPPPSGTCSVNPNPVAKGVTFAITGSGYGAGRYVTLAVSSGSGITYLWAQADSTGTFRSSSRVSTAGSNSVKVHDSIGGALIGSCSFSSY